MKQLIFLVGLTALLGITACKNAEQKPAETAEMTDRERQLSNLNGTEPMLENKWKNASNDLFTDAEFSRLFGEANLKSMNRISRENYLLIEWLKADWVQRDNSNDKSDKYTSPKNNVIIRLTDFGKPNIAADIFRQKVELRTEPWNDQISGIGDGALWSTDGRRLIVLCGQFIANLEVFVEDDGLANLPKAKELAGIVIPKLKK